MGVTSTTHFIWNRILVLFTRWVRDQESPAAAAQNYNAILFGLKIFATRKSRGTGSADSEQTRNIMELLLVANIQPQ